jgi:6-phosphogluconolactonase
MIGDRLEFENRAALAITLARKISHVLSKSITQTGSAVLAVSGGTTPVTFFEHLSATQIEWTKVVVTLVDERDVPADSPRSNARLVRQHLVRDCAAAARFVPLYRNADAGNLPPFTATVLGMGADGHTASFFPGGDTLAEAINPSTGKDIVSISAPGSGEPRLTFTLPRLAASKYLALHIEGAEKKDVLEKALAGGDIMAMPVRSVLDLRNPLHVYWCP